MNAVSQKVHPTRRKRVALYSSDVQFRREVAVRLEALAIYDVHVADATAFLQGANPDARPAVIIFDVGDGQILLEPAVAAARASVRAEVAEETRDYVEEGVAGTAIAVQMGEMPELRDAMSLAWRILLTWLAVLALFVLAGWVA